MCNGTEISYYTPKNIFLLYMGIKQALIRISKLNISCKIVIIMYSDISYFGKNKTNTKCRLIILTVRHKKLQAPREGQFFTFAHMSSLQWLDVALSSTTHVRSLNKCFCISSSWIVATCKQNGLHTSTLGCKSSY